MNSLAQKLYYHNSIDACLSNANNIISDKSVDSIDIKDLQDYIYNILKSKKFLYESWILTFDNENVEFLRKVNNSYKKVLYKNKLKKINEVLSNNYLENPIVNGSLRNDFCIFFEEEDTISFTLFHEIEEYYKKNTNVEDKDRVNILFYINNLENEIRKERNNVIDREKQYLLYIVSILKDEANLVDRKDSTCFNMFNKYIELLQSGNNDNSELVNRIINNHEPKFEGSNENFDGFGQYIKQKCDIKLKEIESNPNIIDKEKVSNSLKILEELIVIKNCLEKLKEILKNKNNTPINKKIKNMLIYNKSISECEKFISFINKLLSKYKKELASLNIIEYSEKEDKKVGTKRVENKKLKKAKKEEKKEVVIEEKDLNITIPDVLEKLEEPDIEVKLGEEVIFDINPFDDVLDTVIKSDHETILQTSNEIKAQPLTNAEEKKPIVDATDEIIEEKTTKDVVEDILDEPIQIINEDSKETDPIVNVINEETNQVLQESKKESEVLKTNEESSEEGVYFRFDPNEVAIEIDNSEKPTIEIIEPKDIIDNGNNEIYFITDNKEKPSEKIVSDIKKEEVIGNSFVESESIINDNYALDIDDDLLELSAQDLYMFGLVSTSDLNKLTEKERESVTLHCNDLVSLIGLSNDQKAKIRASWPRMINDRLIISPEPSKSEINTQRIRDNLRDMYNRIDAFEYLKGPKRKL